MRDIGTLLTIGLTITYSSTADAINTVSATAKSSFGLVSDSQREKNWKIIKSDFNFFGVSAELYTPDYVGKTSCPTREKPTVPVSSTTRECYPYRVENSIGSAWTDGTVTILRESLLQTFYEYEVTTSAQTFQKNVVVTSVGLLADPINLSIGGAGAGLSVNYGLGSGTDSGATITARFGLGDYGNQDAPFVFWNDKSDPNGSIPDDSFDLFQIKIVERDNKIDAIVSLFSSPDINLAINFSFPASQIENVIENANWIKNATTGKLILLDTLNDLVNLEITSANDNYLDQLGAIGLSLKSKADASEEDDDNMEIPEPTSTLSILALGTIGAASTLKRKLKPSKSTEKETTKVG